MYSNGYSTPEASNNPFLNDPAPAHARFPDISSPPPQQFQAQASYGYQSQPQYQQPGQSYQNPAQYQNPQYQNQYQAQYQSPPQYQSTSTSTYNPRYPASPVSPQISQSTGRQFQPSSSFGQHLVSHVDSQYQQQPSYGGGYQQGYQAGYGTPQQQQVTGYPNTGYTQGQQQNQGYLSEFDPYASLGQGQRSGATSPPHGRTPSISGHSHPRDMIRTHKAELEAWDPHTWKQMLILLDKLKDAWGARKGDIDARVSAMGGSGVPGFFGYQGGYGGYGAQQEIDRLKALSREAESNHDSVAASSFQLHEVHQFYRQSGDAASKRRVREACNAALSGLPDMPGPL